MRSDLLQAGKIEGNITVFGYAGMPSFGEPVDYIAYIEDHDIVPTDSFFELVCPYAPLSAIQARVAISYCDLGENTQLVDAQAKLGEHFHFRPSLFMKFLVGVHGRWLTRENVLKYDGTSNVAFLSVNQDGIGEVIVRFIRDAHSHIWLLEAELPTPNYTFFGGTRIFASSAIL